MVHPHPLRIVLPALLAALPGAQGSFTERAVELGLEHECVPGLDILVGPAPDFDYVLDWVQQGMALGDVDGDGDLDVFACGGLGPNHLFENVGGTFVDATDGSGLENRELDRAPYFADFDEDGDLDLFVGSLEGGGLGAEDGRSHLYLNDGTGVFTDVTTLSGVTGVGRSLCASWADFDRDGLLDLYVGEFHHAPNQYYLNNGDGTFAERGEAVGIDHLGSAHSVNAVDSDGDGLLDLYCGVDFDVGKVVGIPPEENFGNACFAGQPGGAFVETTPGSGYDDAKAPMGSTVGDVDYDGDPDLYQSDIGANPLFINHGWPGSGVPWERKENFYKVANATVAPLGSPAGPQPTAGWGVAFFDFDLDSWLDLLVINGHVSGIKPFSSVMFRNQRNFLFRGRGPTTFGFDDVSATYGLTEEIDDRAVAVGDMDADGDLDFFVAPTVGALRYYENQVDTGPNGSVIVAFDTRTSAPHGIGSVVSWTDAGGRPHTRWIGAESPTASQSDLRAHFGIGTESTVDLTVQFPSGMTRVYADVAPGVLTAVEPEMIRLSTHTLPIPLVSLPGEPSEVTVTAFAHDQAGNPLDGTATVTITAGNLQPTGPVTHVGGNEFQRTFQVANNPSSHRVQVSFDGWTVGIEPIVHLTGIVSGPRSTVRVEPGAVRAGSGETFRIVAAPKDAGQRSVGPGHDVVVNVIGVGSLPATDHGDGTYSATFVAPPFPVVAPVDVTVQGVSIGGPVVEVGDVADAAETTVETFTPLPAQSASPHQLKVLVTPRDAQGRRLGRGTPLSLELGPATLPGGGSPATRGSGAVAAAGGDLQSAGPKGGTLAGVWIRDDLTRARDDGTFLFVLEKDPANDALPSGTLRVKVGSALLTTAPYTFRP